MGDHHLGIDVGSTTVKLVVIDDKDQITFEAYRQSEGNPLLVVFQELSLMEKQVDPDSISSVTVTGTGGRTLATLLSAHFVNEIIAHTTASFHFHPEVRSIIEIGGEDAKFILSERGPTGEVIVSDFAMNTACAAGTGVFLDQQAARLGYTIEEFGQLALKSESPPRIAGRCTVFAKSDMIHLQQRAVPDYEIIGGLCFALVRNLKSNILKGRKILPPVVLQGGVAANPGIQRALKEVFDLNPDELIVPKHHFTAGAIGAALFGKRHLEKRSYQGKGELQHFLTSKSSKYKALAPLKLQSPPSTYTFPEASALGWELYLGVDVGSISTKLVLLNERGELVEKVYLRTSGRPLEAVKDGLNMLGDKVGNDVKIGGVGVTGSGRYFIGDFMGADLVRNEIMAQATAAMAIDPEVDTIIEIGGQDSKFISLKEGVILDFTMNKVCAAGTGSFLEEQAQQLGLDMEIFSRLAFRSSSPVQLGERCTVFMESDLLHYQQRGVPKEDLIAGLCYSIVYNYLNRVVEHRKIGKKVFFQGATAYNLGVVAAFQVVLKRPIIVPPHHEVTGAIGVALLAAKERGWKRSRFKGFSLAHSTYRISSFECKGCPNRCEIRELKVEGEPSVFYGGRCEKYELKRDKKENNLPDLLSERESLLLEWMDKERRSQDEVGIPNALFFREWLPFFGTLFQELGFKVVVSSSTNKGLVRLGSEASCAETCFPVKLAHGHVIELLEKGIKTLFLPQIVDFPSFHPKLPAGMACPYVQAFPWMVHASIEFQPSGAKVLQPVLHLGERKGVLKKEIKTFAKDLGVSVKEVQKAIGLAYEAQYGFWNKAKERGKEILSSFSDRDVLCVLVGRPYNALDPGANLMAHRKLRDLGVLALPMDYLPLGEVEDHLSEIQEIYWHYGQRILAVSALCKRDLRLRPIYITNFACGPDSFIIHLFREIMGDCPFLELEIDEHSGDTGVQTRIEAFLDSIRGLQRRKEERTQLPRKLQIIPRAKRARRIYLPPMSRHVEVIAASFIAYGVEALVLPDSDEESLTLGRQYTSGKECYPAVLTAGDMVKMTRRPDFDPAKAAFLMPSGTGPCRFGQYHKLHRLILDKLGYREVPIYSPTQTYTLYNDLGIIGEGFTHLSWQGIVAADILYKLLRETRPHCRDKTEADRLYERCFQLLREAVENHWDLKELLIYAREEFERLRTDEGDKKPIIGIVGEIYTRANPFANERIVEELEGLGSEVWVAPLGEWIFYINFTSKRRARWHREMRYYLRLLIESKIQVRDQHRFEKIVRSLLRSAPEPSIEEVLALARRYISDAFEGEAILSLGKALDYMKKGVDGVVNVIPFTCMPGTVVSAMFKRLKEKYRYPLITVSYDGQKSLATRTVLEAFFYQVQRYREMKGKETLSFKS